MEVSRDSKQPKPKSPKRRQSGGILGKLFLLLVLIAVGGATLWWFTGRSPDRNRGGVAPSTASSGSLPPSTGSSASVSPVIRAYKTNGVVVFVTNDVPVVLAPPAVSVTNPAASVPVAPAVSNRTASWPTNYVTPLPQVTNAAPAAPPSAPIVRVFSTNRVDSNALRTAITPTNSAPVVPAMAGMRSVRGTLEAQIALARLGISSGSFDGAIGSQTRAALRAFQMQQGLAQSGELDAATRQKLFIREPVFTNYLVTTADLARLLPVSDTWLGKSQQSRLDYETLLELVSEKSWSHPAQIRLLNPGVNWSNVISGTALVVPFVDRPPARSKAAFVRIQLSAKTLQAFDAQTNLLAHYPCSIAARVEKRPIGELRVEVFADGPDYTWNPEVFPESPESKTITRKIRIPPGPNNPVGTVWIGLDRPGYGIHGTPQPEQVGRTESHGCFRLANWNAEHLLRLIRKGTPVIVLP